jgi:4-amino-4-deoxy-L-arabinose transferase-like glycosyltransferase
MIQVLRRNPLMFILLGAFVLRAGAAIALQTWLDARNEQRFLIPGDAEGYWELGRKLAAGEEFALYHPPRRVLRMPGFPAVLAASISALGESFLAARLLLAVVGTATCGLAYLLGRELFGETVGLIAAAWTAVSPTMSLFSVLILSETTFAATLLVSLWLMARLIRVARDGSAPTRTYWLAFVNGVAVAGACYMRPSWLLAAPLFAVAFAGWMIWRKRPSMGVVSAALVIVGCAVALAPWTYRNYRVTSHFVPTTLWVGPSLYDGLHPGATGASDMTFYERDRLMQRMSEYDMDQHYRREALQFATQNPQRAAELAAIKLWRYWKPWPNAEQFGHVAVAAAVGVFFVASLVAALVGLWAQRHHVWACLLTAGPILYFAAIHAVFVASLRYRLPAEYPLCVLAAAGLQAMFGPRTTSRLSAK